MAYGRGGGGYGGSRGRGGKEYDNTNRFSLWQNDNARGDRDPQWTGVINVDGREYYINMWEGRGQGGKSPEFTGSIKEKDGHGGGRGGGRRDDRRDNDRRGGGYDARDNDRRYDNRNEARDERRDDYRTRADDRDDRRGGRESGGGDRGGYRRDNPDDGERRRASDLSQAPRGNPREREPGEDEPYDRNRDPNDELPF